MKTEIHSKNKRCKYCGITRFREINIYMSISSNKLKYEILFLIGLLAPGILMSCISLAGCNHTSVVVMLTFSVGMGGMIAGGYLVNHLDISPNFAGILY